MRLPALGLFLPIPLLPHDKIPSIPSFPLLFFPLLNSSCLCPAALGLFSRSSNISLGFRNIAAQGTNYARVPDTGIDWSTRPVSIARYWNEAILFSIRRDLARPVVHARNLFHLSAAMWDGWAMYAPKGELLFWKSKVSSSGWTPQELEKTRNLTISFAAYEFRVTSLSRYLCHGSNDSPMQL